MVLRRPAEHIRAGGEFQQANTPALMPRPGDEGNPVPAATAPR